MIDPIQVPVDGYLAGSAPAMLLDPARRGGPWRSELVPELRRALLLTCRGWIGAYLEDFHAYGLDRAANASTFEPTAAAKPRGEKNLVLLQVRTGPASGGGPGIGIPKVANLLRPKSAEGEPHGER